MPRNFYKKFNDRINLFQENYFYFKHENKSTLNFVVIALLVTILVINVPLTFAQENTIEVSIPSGTSIPGCEANDLCYIPSPLYVKTGDVVLWTNHDSVAHTVSSGSPKDGADGIIYSPLLSQGDSFAFKFNDPGSYPYYCTLHPWMEGIVIVEVPGAIGQTLSEEFELTEHRISSDGSTIIILQTNIPKAGEALPIEIRFTDENDELDHMNYDIKVVQDGEEVFMRENAHSVDGAVELTTSVLESDNPVDIEIGIRGIYLPSESSQPVEDVITFAQVPEFGEIAMLVLISSITAMTIMRFKTPIISRF